MPTEPASIQRENNSLLFPPLRHPRIVGNFIRNVYQANHERGYQDLVLDLSWVAAAFPNACTPIAGLIDFYRESGLGISATNVSESINRIGLLTPLDVKQFASQVTTTPLNTVWRYSTAEEAAILVNAFVGAISRVATCEAGVLPGLEWSLNEVLDNVLQHANSPHGFVMGQVHPTTQHIALCVFDHGQGIYNTLRESQHAPLTSLDAITISMREGVTRDKQIGQGNGLWGLHNIVRQNSGILGITSGSATYRTESHNAQPYTSQFIPYLSNENQCTTVDFQIDFDKPIQLSEALGGYQPTNLRLEEIEDDAGNYLVRLADKSSGTGTRRSGIAMRNEIGNIARESTHRVIIDFSGVAVVSSSFADELVGKLVAEFGFIAFTQRFQLKNMNDFVEAIINRAVSQRLGLNNGH